MTAKPQKLSNGVIITSIIFMFAALGYAMFVPTKSANGLVKGRRLTQASLLRDIERLKELQAAAQRENDAHFMQGDTDQITTKTLQYCKVLSDANGLELAAVRPQRKVVIGAFAEIPFSIQMIGTAPSVLRTIRSMDKAANQFVVRSIQINPVDTGGVSMVSANLVLVCYQLTAKGEVKAK